MLARGVTARIATTQSDEDSLDSSPAEIDTMIHPSITLFELRHNDTETAYSTVLELTGNDASSWKSTEFIDDIYLPCMSTGEANSHTTQKLTVEGLLDANLSLRSTNTILLIETISR